jgi:hypothetical protein
MARQAEVVDHLVVEEGGVENSLEDSADDVSDVDNLSMRVIRAGHRSLREPLTALTFGLKLKFTTGTWLRTRFARISAASAMGGIFLVPRFEDDGRRAAETFSPMNFNAYDL